MTRGSVLVLGGGLSGMAAAWSLARAGVSDVTLVERGPELGGLAGTFTRGDHFYPLGYHHILHRGNPRFVGGQHLPYRRGKTGNHQGTAIVTPQQRDLTRRHHQTPDLTR